MNRVAKFTTITSIFLLILSVILLTLIHSDISKIGTQDFDMTKWLDADIFLWKWGWYSLILGVLLNVISIILKTKGVLKK